jgi:hypothetical protein
VAESVGELIATLDDRSGAGEEAKFELIARGADVVPELVSRLVTLERFGKLSAIEAFEALQDARACPALIGLLADDDQTVVEWAAGALGSLGCRDAVEPLQRVVARLIAEHVPPDWTAPVRVRAALTRLGARRPIVPRATADRRLSRDDTEMWLFRSSDLVAVLDDLAEHSQVVLGFSLWRIGGDERLYWTRHESEGWSFAWSERWVDNVTAAQQTARRDATTVRPAPDLLAHVEWIHEADVMPNPAPDPGQREPADERSRPVRARQVSPDRRGPRVAARSPVDG